MQGKSITEGHIQQGNKKLNEKRIHPTQKPINLYLWILQKYAKQSDKLLDTHVGSASSLIACEKFGLKNYVGFEIDNYYYGIASKRLAEYRKVSMKKYRIGDIIDCCNNDELIKNMIELEKIGAITDFVYADGLVKLEVVDLEE